MTNRKPTNPATTTLTVLDSRGDEITVMFPAAVTVTACMDDHHAREHGNIEIHYTAGEHTGVIFIDDYSERVSHTVDAVEEITTVLDAEDAFHHYTGRTIPAKPRRVELTLAARANDDRLDFQGDSAVATKVGTVGGKDLFLLKTRIWNKACSFASYGAYATTLVTRRTQGFGTQGFYSAKRVTTTAGVELAADAPAEAHRAAARLK